MRRESDFRDGRMISWAVKVEVKVKNEIENRNRNPAKAGQVLCFIFDICDDNFDLIFNFTLSLEPRLALTFLPV